MMNHYNPILIPYNPSISSCAMTSLLAPFVAAQPQPLQPLQPVALQRVQQVIEWWVWGWKNGGSNENNMDLRIEVNDLNTFWMETEWIEMDFDWILNGNGMGFLTQLERGGDSSGYTSRVAV